MAHSNRPVKLGPTLALVNLILNGGLVLLGFYWTSIGTLSYFPPTWRGHRVLTTLLALILSSNTWAHNNLSQKSSSDLSAPCAKLVQNIKSSSNLNLMNQCLEFYWHNGDSDPLPGPYTSMIAIGYRYVEVEPKAAEVYTTIAWLEWSGYVTWKSHPEDVPNGEQKAERSVALLEKGLIHLGNSADFVKDCADTIWPFAQNHRPDFFPFVIRNYERGFSLFTAVDKKIRLALNLGHIYRRNLNDKPNAVNWYRTVLSLDSTNKVALRYLNEIGETP